MVKDIAGDRVSNKWALVGTKSSTVTMHVINLNYDKAEEFNKAFSKFATIDTSNASLPDIAYKTNSRLNSINITQAETLDILKSLDTSKATGPDGISCKMLKETADSIAPSFTRLLQLSLSTAKVPSCWKQANVLPIFKKGDQSDFGNYRPVSLLNISSNVCEKIIFKHLFNYCRDNNNNNKCSVSSANSMIRRS